MSEWPIWKCSKWPTTHHQTNSHADTPAPVSGRKAYVGAGKEIELVRRPLQCCSWEMTLNITLIPVVISQLRSLLNFSHHFVFSYWSARMHGTDSAVYSVPCVPCSVHGKLLWVILLHIIHLPLTCLRNVASDMRLLNEAKPIYFVILIHSLQSMQLILILTSVIGKGIRTPWNFLYLFLHLI